MANAWDLNDTYPLFMGTEFEPSAPEWADVWWWGGPLVMALRAEDAPAPRPRQAGPPRKMTKSGFFGPKTSETKR